MLFVLPPKLSKFLINLLQRFRRSLVNAQRHVIFVLMASALANLWILFVAEINVIGGCDIDPGYEHLYNVSKFQREINIT